MRRLLAGAGVVTAVVALGSMSWTPPVTWRLADEQHEPVSEAYVGYHHVGSLLNPVHSVTYKTGPLAIAQVDAHGKVTVPARLHLRPPLPPSLPPTLVVGYVYVPRLHHAFGPLTERTESAPGVFTLNHRQSIITVFDVSGHPVRWESSLRTLHRFAREALESPRTDVVIGRELAHHLRREYGALHDRYGKVRRERPARPSWMSASDREKWLADVDAHLAREPLWGPYLERVWRRDLDALERLAQPRDQR